MSRSRIIALRIMMTIIAAGMIAYGAYRGEVSVVFTKAVNLCFECVGLG